MINKKNEIPNNDLSSEDDSSNTSIEMRNSYFHSTNIFDVGNHVIVVYEDEYFPGVIKIFKKSEYEVNT